MSGNNTIVATARGDDGISFTEAIKENYFVTVVLLYDDT